MRVLDNFATSSNEKREQRIMRLRNSFGRKEIITVGAAAKKLALSRNTIIKYCRDGNIPLIDGATGQPVVPLTVDNRPRWLD